MNIRSNLKNLELYQLWLAGKSYHEIGRLMGCSPNTVRTRIQRDREQLEKEAWERDRFDDLSEYNTDDESDIFI